MQAGRGRGQSRNTEDIYNAASQSTQSSSNPYPGTFNYNDSGHNPTSQNNYGSIPTPQPKGLHRGMQPGSILPPSVTSIKQRPPTNNTIGIDNNMTTLITYLGTINGKIDKLIESVAGLEIANNKIRGEISSIRTDVMKSLSEYVEAKSYEESYANISEEDTKDQTNEIKSLFESATSAAKGTQTVPKKDDSDKEEQSH